MLRNIIEKFYKNTAFVRFDERDTAFYFSYTDFEGVNMEPYTFKNKWGEDLKAFFYYPDHEIPGRVIVFEHGIGSGHRSYMREISMLVAHGYRVLAYDRTGCASSPGDGAKGLVASLCDLDYCLRGLKSNVKYKDADISVIGHSWGGFSALNVLAYHPDITHVVAMSGFRSLSVMLEQRIPMKRIRGYVDAIERSVNPEYVDSDAATALSDSDVPVLIIHSSDDKVVSCKKHFDTLARELSDKENIRFIKLDGKAHNPSYTYSAVKKLADFAKKLSTNSKKLKTSEQKRAFVNSFDWYAITEQDDTVWREIFDALDK